MRIRAGVILLCGDSLALIRRIKPSRQYFVIPGGGVEEGEYTEDGATRETKEELGIAVEIQRLVAVVEKLEGGRITHLQLYYHAEMGGGVFGSGVGEEFFRSERHGSYEPIWLPLSKLHKHEVYPNALANYLSTKGLPKQILHLKEPHDNPPSRSPTFM